MLMPLLGSPAPVFLFNDDWRAGRAILRTGDFNKETALEVGWHGNDLAILIFYVFNPDCKFSLLCLCFISLNEHSKKVQML